jgi:hypothetical protein
MKTIFRATLQIQTFLCVISAVVVSPHIAIAQKQPGAADILKRVGKTYANPKRYQFSVSITSRELDRKGQMKVDTQTLEFAVKLPNKMRMFDSNGAKIAENSSGEMLVIVDGEYTWSYVPKIKQYMKYKGAPVHTDPHDDESETKAGAPSEFINHMEELLLFRYRNFVKVADRAKLIRQESIRFAGKSVDCYVVEIDSSSPPTQGPSLEL